MLDQAAGHDPRLQHERIDAPEVAPRGARARIVRAAAHRAIRVRRGAAHAMTSITPPCGTSSFPRPCPGQRTWRSRRRRAGAERIIASSTNITVADDMLPKRRSTSREIGKRGRLERRRRAAPRRSPRCRRDAPPRGRSRWAARRTKSRSPPALSARRITPGTRGDSTISNPQSRMCQVISSLGLRHQHRAEAVECESLAAPPTPEQAAQPSANNRERQHLLEIRRSSAQMQRAKLEIEDQHARVGLGAHDVSRELERIDRRMAAHEPDHDPLDRARQSAALDHCEIKAGGGKAGAAGDQNMGDAVAFVAQMQPIDRLRRKLRCVRRRRRACAPPCSESGRAHKIRPRDRCTNSDAQCRPSSPCDRSARWGCSLSPSSSRAKPRNSSCTS